MISRLEIVDTYIEDALPRQRAKSWNILYCALRFRLVRFSNLLFHSSQQFIDDGLQLVRESGSALALPSRRRLFRTISCGNGIAHWPVVFSA